MGNVLAFSNCHIEKAAKLQPKKGERWEAKLNFDELIFMIEGETLHCLAWITETDAYPLADKKTGAKPEFPGLAYFSFEKGDDSCASAFVEEMKKLDASCTYKGFLKPNPGVPMKTPEMRAIMLPEIFKLETTTNEKVDKGLLKPAPKSSGSNYKSTSKDEIASQRMKAIGILMNEGNPISLDETIALVKVRAEAAECSFDQYLALIKAVIE